MYITVTLGPKLRDANLGTYLSHLGLELHVSGWNNEVTGCRTERTLHWGSRCDTPGVSFPAHCQLFSGHWRSERAWCEKLYVCNVLISLLIPCGKITNKRTWQFSTIYDCGFVVLSILCVNKIKFSYFTYRAFSFFLCESLKFKPKSGRG